MPSTKDDIEATLTAQARHRSTAGGGERGRTGAYGSFLEQEVDDEGHAETLVAGGDNDAVRVLAARRRLHFVSYLLLVSVTGALGLAERAGSLGARYLRDLLNPTSHPLPI
jgi:hypothetical protein